MSSHTVLNEQPPGVNPAREKVEVYMYPASLQQQQLWFLDQLLPGNPAYNIPLAYELQGKVDVRALNRSLAWLVNRHETFRTRFAIRGGELLQVVHTPMAIAFREIDLRGVEAEEREKRCKEEIRAEAAFRFDLATGPLVRGTIIQLEEGRTAMMINCHHAILDHLSVLQLGKELTLAYESFRRGMEPDLEEPALQYPDFSVWQQEQMADDSFHEDVRTWVERLSKCTSSLDFPVDRVRPATQSFKGREIPFSLPTVLSARVREFARRSKKTPYMTMLTVFNCLLARYSGQDDIVVGSPFSNRLVGDLEGVMGCCMNTLPLATDLREAATFSEAMEAVHRTIVDAYLRQRVPFKVMVDGMKHERDAGRNPLCQVLFTLQDAPMSLELDGLEVRSLGVHNETSKFDISLWVWDDGEQFRGLLEYNTDVFELGSMERMLSSFEVLLSNLLEQPDAPWRRLAMVGGEDMDHILGGWQGRRVDVEGDVCVHDVIREQALRTPGRTAVICGNDKIDYASLLVRVSQISAALRAKGAGRGSLVGIYMERSIEMVAAVLGVLDAGAAYVPMDPAFPSERVGWMVEDAEIKVIVTENALAGLLPAHEAQVVCLDDVAGEVMEEDFGRRASVDDLAYVIFTSGSTGRPKGVQIEHRALLNFLRSMREEPGIATHDVLLAVTTLSFDIAGLELLLPLMSGACVVIAPRAIAGDGARLLEEMVRVGATVLQATPVTWRLLIAAGWKGDKKLKVLIGGEAVPRELVNELIPRSLEVWNMYGPTETTIWSTTGRLEIGEGAVSIGRPIANTQIYVVNEQMQLQPVGVPGELLIGGAGLARGYLKREELTKEKFIRNPFGEGRLYRTGDLAKWRNDGTLECLGRLDFQVKLRGYRIELGEIESMLTKEAGFCQAVVVLRDEQLVAYVAGAGQASEETFDSEAVRRKLRNHLPEYMVPAVYVPMDSIPLTPNGKIDRKALPEPDGSVRGALLKGHVEARTDCERRMVGIWERVLKRSPIGIHDNFFELGGHSFLAVQLFAEIEKEMSGKLPLATLFQHPTVAGLATCLEADGGERTVWKSLVTIRSGTSRIGLYLVHGAGGNVLIYRTLASHIRAEIPVYGLQSLGLDGTSAPLRSIGEMAEKYVEEVISSQPEGPYHVGGYCMGGKIALEMARQLRAMGREVGLLVLLDTYNYNRANAELYKIPSARHYLELAYFHWRNLSELELPHRIRYLSGKARMAREYLWGRLRSAWHGMKVRREGSHGGVEMFLQKANDAAGFDYVPEPYDGPVVLLKPRATYSALSDRQMGWGDVMKGRMEIVELDFRPHAMLMEPYARLVASELNSRLVGSGLVGTETGRMPK